MQDTTPDPAIPDGYNYGDVRHPDERTYATILHLSSFTSLVTSGFGGILGPLIVWLIFRARSDMVDFHGKKALNFHLTILALFIPLMIIVIPAWIVTAVALENEEFGSPFWIGLALTLGSAALMMLLALVAFIWTIVAAVRASRGDPPGYIIGFRFLR